MKKSLLVAGIITLLIILSIYLSTNYNQNEEKIKIGAILPLSGIFAENGQNSLQGYQFAIEEVNKQGGVNNKELELIVESHQGNDKVGAISAYNKLKMQGIKIILGPNHSPTGLAVVPLACQDEILLISPAIGTKEFSPTCNLIFDTWPVDFLNSKSLGSKIVQKGYKDVAIIGSVQSWEKEQAEAAKKGVKEAGGKVVQYIITDNTNNIAYGDITKIISANPDGIIFTNYGFMHLYAKKLREAGSNAQFFEVILDETRKEGSEGAFEGSIIISSYTPTKEFKQNFYEKFGRYPDFPADTSYDTIKVITKALKATKSTNPQDLSQEISTYKNYQGASGNFSFLPSGDVIKKPTYQQVLNNTIVSFAY